MNLLLDWRDRLLQESAFQRWAAKFPLTRPVARREARALFDICAGFVYAQVLAACLELDIFERLAAGPQRLEALALFCALPPASMQMLAEAAQSLRLLNIRRGLVRLGPLGAALRGNPGLAAMVAHHKLFYADIADPVALLRGQTTPQLASFWPYGGQPGKASAYSALMAATQPMIAAEILDAYPVAKHSVILDIGGGDGSFLRQVAVRAPCAALQLFDLPEVTELARQNFERANLTSRTTINAGDFTQAALPRGADLITLVRVLHDQGDEKALALLRAIRAAVSDAAVLLIGEPMAGTKGAEPASAAYFGFYLHAMRSGRMRRPEDIAKLLAQAGFSRVWQRQTAQPLLASVMLAQA